MCARAPKALVGLALRNFFDGMDQMDDTTRALDPDMIEALGLTMPAD